MTVGEACTRAVVTAHQSETVVEAARRMRDFHVGDVVVIDAAHHPIGVLTDRDIVVSAVAQSPDEIPSLLVGDVMTRDLATARDDETLDDALSRMRGRGIRRLPVLSPDGKLEGILTLDDVLEVMSLELDQLIRLVAHEQRREREVRA